MHDRVMAVGLLLVIGICCIGAYVAVSGFWLVSPNGVDLSFLSSIRTPPPFSSGTFIGPTSVAGQSSGTLEPAIAPTSTLSPTITPKGFKPSATPAQAATQTPFPEITFVATQSPIPLATSAPAPASGQANCQGFDYCPQNGPPDSVLAPTGKGCPPEYLWGRVVDQNGQGVTNVRVKFVDSAGNTGAPLVKDRAPDLPGAWNLPTGGPSGTWRLQLQTADGRALSPVYEIIAGHTSASGGLCGTRVDFRRVR